MLRPFAILLWMLLALPLWAWAAPPRDRLTLLVPDGANTSSWQIRVWTDTALEEGMRLDLLSDSAFLAMGNTAASKIAGLIVPDSGHQKASDAVVTAIKQYATQGGKLMLVYDAGVLGANGTYPLTGNSRFSDLVGVQYVLWRNGVGASSMVGFGPVLGTKPRLESLAFPPGKYAPYAVSAASSVRANVAYVPVSALDPGGSQIMQPAMVERAAQPWGQDSSNLLRMLPRLGRGPVTSIVTPPSVLQYSPNQHSVTNALVSQLFQTAPQVASNPISAQLGSDLRTVVEQAAPIVDTSLQAINGYGYGPLGYYSYVTTGTFAGTAYLSSPDHGLVAGLRSTGSGQLLFVNLPLGYFKAIGSDAAPLHGFLGHFARNVVGVATQSVQPQGKGGLIYNWHVDDGDDLLVDTRQLLNSTHVLQSGPFSIHFTAGPDVINVGDRKGMNLNGNAQSKDLVRRLGNIAPYANPPQRLAANHELGSHGGWIHDYWGRTANETNVPNLTTLLSQNFDAIEAVTGRRIKEYSSPQGNTPRWAVNWLEQRGVVAMYLVADGGTGALRSWRGGSRLAGNTLWSFPVTTLGPYATFEEFEENGVSDVVAGQWLLDLQSFVVNQRTNRMFYTHPPGIVGHLSVIQALLARGTTLKNTNTFDWYTMRQLAEFSERRIRTSWNSTMAGNLTTFTASNPTSLQDITWLLPRASFSQPNVVSGSATVTSDSVYWLIKAGAGTSLKFAANAI